MAFHDVRLPEDVEQNAQGGPKFKTSIMTLSAGYEKRNIDWSQTRASYNVGYGIQTKDDFKTIIEFFHAREGRAHSFRFKDWSDFELAAQSIGTTDTSTSTFQIYKQYTSGVNTYNKTLDKIVNGSVQAWVNSVAQTVVYDTAPAAGEVSVALLTGIVTLGSTHVATTGFDVEILCEFDKPVRFDTDDLTITIVTFDAGAIPTLPLIEVRGE